MADLANSFEGGTTGTTITTANSGSTSGDAFNSTSIGTSATLTFDNGHAAHGSLAALPATSSSDTVYSAWTVSGSTIYLRMYCYITGAPAANTNILRLVNGGTILFTARINSTGKLAFLWSSGTLGGTSTNSVNTAAWFRIEASLDLVAGNISVYLFNSMDSTTPTETLSVSGVNPGSTSATQVRYGIVSNATWSYWMDDLGASLTALMGPATVGGNSYTQTMTDTSGLTDSATEANAHVPVFTDPQGLTDSLTVVCDHVLTVSDIQGLTDASTASAAHFVSAQDDQGLTDSVAQVKTLAANVSDVTGLADALNTVHAIGLPITDDTGRTDSIVSTAKVAALSDNQNLSDLLLLVVSKLFVLDDSTGRIDAIASTNKTLDLTDDRGLLDYLVFDTQLYFITPSYKQRVVGWPNRSRLWDRVSFDVGKTLLLSGGSYKLYVDADPVDIESADKAYLGGRLYRIGPEEAASLREAGYGHWITNDPTALPTPEDGENLLYGEGLYGSGLYGD